MHSHRLGTQLRAAGQFGALAAILVACAGDKAASPDGTAGVGLITPQSALTNACGEVNTKWTLGPVAGANTMTATVANLAPVMVTATATP